MTTETMADTGVTSVRAVQSMPTLTTDPARRPDVLLRVRHAPDHQPSAWWFVLAFLATSVVITAGLSFLPPGT